MGGCWVERYGAECCGEYRLARKMGGNWRGLLSAHGDLGQTWLSFSSREEAIAWVADVHSNPGCRCATKDAQGTWGYAALA
jgi:hypothetical protein